MAGERVGERRWLGGVAAAALLLGALLRVRHSFTYPLWLDEAYTAYAADHGFAFLWQVVPRYETHPPLYYALMRLWSFAAGDSLAARRWPGVLCGTGAVVAIGLAAHRLARLLRWRETARVRLIALTVTIAALHPMLIWLSREARPYAPMALVYAAAIAVLLRLAIAARDAVPLPRRGLALFAALEALMCWLHTVGPLFGGALGLALLILVARRTLGRREWAWLAASQGAAGLLYLPAFAIMLGQAPTWVRTTWLKFSVADLNQSLGLTYLSVGAIGQLVCVAGGAAGAVRLVRGDRRAGAAVAVLALLPSVAAILVSLAISPIFLVRTASPCALPFALLLAAAIGWPRPLYWLAALALPAIASEAAIDREFATQPPLQDWYGLIGWIGPRFHAGDMIWAYPNEGALPLAYALRDEHRALPIRPIPGPVPAFGLGGYYLTGSRGVVSLYPREIAALVRSPAATRPGTIWLLRVGPWDYDPGDRLLRALEATRVEIARRRTNQIELIGLRRRGLPPVAPPEQPQP